MYRIIDGRGTGKTGRLFLLAKENNGVIVCGQPRAMKAKAEAYGIVGLDFYSYGDLLSGKLKGFNNKLKSDKRPIYIDELECFLPYINVYIDGYTLSEE